MKKACVLKLFKECSAQVLFLTMDYTRQGRREPQRVINLGRLQSLLLHFPGGAIDQIAEIGKQMEDLKQNVGPLQTETGDSKILHFRNSHSPRPISFCSISHNKIAFQSVSFITQLLHKE